MTIGETIRAARKKAGLTQVELGKKLGVSGSMIGQWENNLRNPKITATLKIADALGAYFFELLDPSDPLRKLLDQLNQIPNQIEKKNIEIVSGTFKQLDYFGKTAAASIMMGLMALNKDGLQVAVERVEELTEIPKYQRPASPDSTPKEKKPSDE